MRVLFYTYDLKPGRERLMPWKTVLEAVSNISADGKYVAEVRDAARISEDNVSEDDVIFFPATWRMGLKSLSFLQSIRCKKIAYFPGGVYPLSGAVALVMAAGIRTALPYLLEALVPHYLLIQRLKRAGFTGIVGQSDLTARDAVKNGWDMNRAFTALPGMDTDVMEKDFSVIRALGLEGKKFLLYSGAPAPIRGSQIAIRAFDSIAESVQDTKFVMLLRTDNGSDYTSFERQLSKVRNKESFVIFRDRLTYPQLGAFFSSAYAAVLPFVLIPSEMPLTYFDLLACGTPVISFNNGGTTEYLKSALKLAGCRTAGSLADAMIELCHNAAERNSLSAKGIELMKTHPTWAESSKIWIQAIEQSA